MLVLLCLLMSALLVSRIAPLVRRSFTPIVTKMVEQDVALNLWYVTYSTTVVLSELPNTATQHSYVQDTAFQTSNSYSYNKGIRSNSFYGVLCSHTARNAVVRFPFFLLAQHSTHVWIGWPRVMWSRPFRCGLRKIGGLMIVFMAIQNYLSLFLKVCSCLHRSFVLAAWVCSESDAR